MTNMLDQYKDLVSPYDAMHEAFCEELRKADAKYGDDNDTSCEDLINVLNAFENIRLFGVTPAVCTDYADFFWDKFEFDLHAFEGASNESLSYCVEGIGKTISDLIERIRRMFLRIAEWFANDTFFYRYSSLMAFWTAQFNAAYAKYHPTIAAIDHAKWRTLTISGFDKQTFVSLIDPIADVLDWCKCEAPKIKDLKTAQQALDQQLFNDGLHKLGYSLVNGYLKQDYVITRRQDTMINMGWGVPTDLFSSEVRNGLSNDILSKTPDFTRLKYQIRRTILDWDYKLRELKNTANVNTALIDEADKVRHTFVVVKTILKEAMTLSSVLARQWCIMVNKFPEAAPHIVS